MAPRPSPSSTPIPDEQLESAARAMYEAYFPAEGRAVPSEWPSLSVRVRETWIAMVRSAQPHLLAVIREHLLGDEAVEAAAKADFERIDDGEKWAALGEGEQEEFRQAARVVTEAALSEVVG